MKNTKKFASRWLITSAAALLLVAGAVSTAQAQKAAPTPPPAPAQPKVTDHSGMGHGGMGGMGGMGHGGMGDGGVGGMDHAGGGGDMMKQMMCGFTEHLDARLAYLRTELKITEQQMPQWNAFADAWRAIAQKASAKCAAADEHQTDGKHDVLSQLSMMEDHMVDHLEVVRAQKAALEPLFNALSDDQKKAANETLTGVMKVGMSMGRGGMGSMQREGGGMGGMGSMGHGGMGQGGGMGGMQH
jgi:hypothetical protein